MFSELICMKYLKTGKCLDEACKLKHVKDIGSLDITTRHFVKKDEADTKKPTAAKINEKNKTLEDAGKEMTDGYRAATAPSRGAALAIKSMKEEAAEKKAQKCEFLLVRGSCRYGDKCFFSHEGVVPGSGKHISEWGVAISAIGSPFRGDLRGGRGDLRGGRGDLRGGRGDLRGERGDLRGGRGGRGDLRGRGRGMHSFETPSFDLTGEYSRGGRGSIRDGFRGASRGPFRGRGMSRGEDTFEMPPTIIERPRRTDHTDGMNRRGGMGKTIRLERELEGDDLDVTDFNG